MRGFFDHLSWTDLCPAVFLASAVLALCAVPASAQVNCGQSSFPDCRGACPRGQECAGAGGAGECHCEDIAPSGRVPCSPIEGQVLEVAKAPGLDITLTWGDSCLADDTDYAIYDGQIGAFYSHEHIFCSTGGATSIPFSFAPGNRYYIVVPRNAVREGSYGIDSAGAQRPQGAPACRIRLTGPCTGGCDDDLDCDDQDACTVDVCDLPSGECLHVPVVPCCGNGIVEPGEQCDPPDGATCDEFCQIIEPFCCFPSGECVILPPRICEAVDGTPVPNCDACPAPPE